MVCPFLKRDKKQMNLRDDEKILKDKKPLKKIIKRAKKFEKRKNIKRKQGVLKWENQKTQQIIL